MVSCCLAAVEPDGLGVVDEDRECVCGFGGGGLEGGEEAVCEGVAGSGEGGLGYGVILWESLDKSRGTGVGWMWNNTSLRKVK